MATFNQENQKVETQVNISEDSAELEYLRFFFAVADFGPSDGDVRQNLNEQFKDETGKDIPDGYECE